MLLLLVLFSEHHHPFSFLFSHLPVFGFLFCFLVVWLCLSPSNRERCPTPWLNKQAKETYTKNIRGRVDGKENKGLGEDRGKQHTKDVCRMVVYAAHRTNKNWDGRRKGGGSSGEQGKKESNRNKGTKNPNFEHSKGNTSRVAWCGIRRFDGRFCANRVTFQFISPSMLIASTVFWFILFCGMFVPTSCAAF